MSEWLEPRKNKPRDWTQREKDLLGQSVGKLTHAQIGRKLGRSETTVKSAARRFRLIADRRYSAELKERVKQMLLEKKTARTIAAAIGRTVGSVHRLRARLGLSRTHAPHGQAFEDFIRDRHAAGWSDNEIAAEWSVPYPDCAPTDRHLVGNRRRKMVLCDNALSDHFRQIVRQNTAQQLARAGLPTLAAVRAKVFRDRAIAAGWPSDLRPRQVQMLNALWELGPMTREEIAAAIGMPWKGSCKSLTGNVPRGTYLANLMTRGLVVNLGRKLKRPGKSKNVCVYSVSLWIERKVV